MGEHPISIARRLGDVTVFEDQIAQGLDMIRRLETNIGLSSEQFGALPESSKVRAEEVLSWENFIEYGIVEFFGRESSEKRQWEKTGKDYFDRKDFGPSGSIKRLAAQIGILRELNGKLKIAEARSPKSKLPIIIQGGFTMGDSYNVGQAGAVGPNATAINTNFQNAWNLMQGSLDTRSLASELAKLQDALRGEAKNPEDQMSIGAVAAAEHAAKQGDGPKALEYLKKAGSWALDVASKIGVNVASTAIKAALGIG